jgi:hypothetical protein
MLKSRINEGTVVPKSGQLSPAGRLAKFLRVRHPFKTAVAVEAESGVSADAIKKLLNRGSMPSFMSLARLLEAYGPELLEQTLDHPPEWLRAAAAEHKG